MAPSTASGQPLLEALTQGVHSLSTRTPEVHKAQKNLQTGELVLIADYSVPRHQWPIELVTDAFPAGPDGLVRSVEVRAIGSTYRRPITKVCLLEESDSGEAQGTESL